MLSGCVPLHCVSIYRIIYKNIVTYSIIINAWSVYIYLYIKLLPRSVLTLSVAMKIGVLAEKASIEWIVTTCGAVVENHKIH